MQNLNAVQRHILTKLLTSAKPLRYRDMKPEDVENDLYNYHLQFLVKKGLIEKIENNYLLSEYGMHYIVEIEPIDAFGRKQYVFKVNVISNLIRTNNGKIEVLTQIRKRHPFFGQKITVGGNLKKGEGICEAAARNLFEKTGLSAEFKLNGSIRRIVITKENKIFNDMIFFICFADKHTGNLIQENDFGVNKWENLDIAIKAMKANKSTLLKLADVLEGLKQAKLEHMVPFCYEETFYLQK